MEKGFCTYFSKEVDFDSTDAEHGCQWCKFAGEYDEVDQVEVDGQMVPIMAPMWCDSFLPEEERDKEAE